MQGEELVINPVMTNQFRFDDMVDVMLISTDRLAPLLDDPDTILADSRTFAEYSAGHIPGAVHLDLFAFHWLDTTKSGIEGFDCQAGMLLSLLGAAPGKRLIFYDSISGMLAARGVWMSMYLRHDNAMMLDGGIAKWKAEGRPMERHSNAFEPSEFQARPDHTLIAGFEHVRKNLDGLHIIDARSPEEYDGSVVRAARPGHIPGAVNIDWRLNLNDGVFKSVEGLSGIYDMPRNSKIITYCQGAYRAASTFLALKLLGFDNARVYLGSWGEWGNRQDLPVER